MSQLILRNARLEDRFVEEQGVLVAQSHPVDIHVNNGLISEIVASSPVPTLTATGAQVIDLEGQLVTPSYREIHCHLDKTLLGEQWRPLPTRGNLFDQFEREKNELPKLKTTLRERAQHLVETYLAQGVTHLRTHVDIYPEVGLKHLETVLAVLSEYRELLSTEVVLFPQHGLLRSGAVPLLNEAINLGGTHIGGVDPATVDGDLEASVRATVQLAADHGLGIDLHLHDPDQLGLFTIHRLLDLGCQAGVKDIAVSHAFCLGQIPDNALHQVADALAAAGATIITSAPIKTAMPPVEYLLNRGVKVRVGCDNIYDLWSPFGNGDLQERLARLAEQEKWIEERSLFRSLGLITSQPEPFSTNGDPHWLRIGDPANLLATPAFSSAELVARRIKPTLVTFNGQVRSLKDAASSQPFSQTPVLRG